MPKPIKQKKRPKDVNALAHVLVTESVQEDRENIPVPSQEQISALMAELGRKGGKVGGKRRLETMTAKQRSSIARKAARARWAK